MAKISTVVIAKNEQNTLPNLIKSVKGVDEILVLDTGSTDDTIKVAKSLGARVVEKTFNVIIDQNLKNKIDELIGENDIKVGDMAFNFGEARNYAASQAKNDIIFMPDCDEIVEWDLPTARKLFDEGVHRLEYNFVFSWDPEGKPLIQFIHSKFYDRRKFHWVRFIHEVLVPKIYTNKVEGWMSDKELNFLYELSKRYKIIAEIGSWKGRSTNALLEGCKGQVTAIDHFEGSNVGDGTYGAVGVYEEFLKNTKQFGNLRTLKMSSEEAMEKLKDEKFEMIFIDGEHTYEGVKEDIKLWKDKATKILCGHDYCDAWKDLKRAVNEELGEVKVVDSIWYVLKDEEGVPDVEFRTRYTDKVFLKHYQNQITNRQQYLKGLAIDYIQNSYDDRNCHYFARELLYCGKHKEAIKMFEQHVEKPGWHTEKGQSLIFMGNAYRALKNDQKAMECYARGFTYDMNRREGLLSMAQVKYEQRAWQEAERLYWSALQIPKGNYYANFAPNYTHLPWGQLSVCLFNQGKTGEAYKCLKKALEYEPNNATYLNNLRFFPDEFQNKRVSIIIPTLGLRPEGLERCKKSIENLKYPKDLIETIVVKDEPRLGLPKRLNEGFGKSTGELIVFASDDTEFTPDSLKFAVEASAKNDLVAFNTGKLLPDNGNICEHFLIKREFVLNKLKGRIFDEELSHCGTDNLLWAQANEYGKAVRSEQAVLNHHHFTKGVEQDETYKKAWENVKKDREVLKKKLDKLNKSTEEVVADAMKIEGMVNERELAWLCETAKGMDSICEIGSWAGCSTYALLSGCDGTVYSIDHFKGSADPIETGHRDIYPDFLKNVGHFKNLKIRKTTSSEASKEFEDNSVDMVFIDGGHQYHEVVEDIKNWKPKAKKILCGHDYQAEPVAKAVNELLGKPEVVERIWFFRLDDLLHQLKGKVEKGENFNFVKMGDGEMTAMLGVEGENCDGQKYTSELQEALKKAYKKIGEQENTFITKWKYGMEKEREGLEKELGIKCEADHELLLHNKLSPYQYNFWEAIKKSKRHKIFVGPTKLKEVNNFLDIDEFIEVPERNAFDFNPEIKAENAIILFSSGLASKVWISEVMDKNSTCIDCGSAFDPIFVGNTRLGQVSRQKLLDFYWTLTKTNMLEMFNYSQENHPERLIAEKEVEGSGVILDIGCGEHKTIPSAVGIDIKKGADLIASADNLPIKSSSVDAIIARHLFEHMLNPIKTIKEWLRVLKKGGKAIMVLPDHSRLNTMKEYLSNNEHNHAYTQETLKDLLSLFNVKIEKIGVCVKNWSFYCVFRKI